VRNLIWSTTFVRAFKRRAHHQPELQEKVKRTLEQLAEDPFHPSLRSHKLKGDLSPAWACTVDYHNHIIFDFVPNPNSKEDDILLLTMGTHDEVY